MALRRESWLTDVDCHLLDVLGEVLNRVHDFDQIQHTPYLSEIADMAGRLSESLKERLVDYEGWFREKPGGTV